MPRYASLVLSGTLIAFARMAQAQTVAVTPLGLQAGDLCRNDRAVLFEDPTGVRLLYDPGRTVHGGGDTRLGDVHVILLSHAHGDHLGDRDVGSVGCGDAPGGSSFPQTNLADIAVAKHAVVIGGGELAGAGTATFLNQKIWNLQKLASSTAPITPVCVATGVTNETSVPQLVPCVAVLRVGGSRTVRMSGAPSGIQIAAVKAVHDSGIPGNFMDPPAPAANVGYGGDAVGYVVTFSNGLTVYLTGDTGMFGDMDTIIRRYYRPSLVVFNIGDVFTTGPDEAAFAVHDLIKPRTVMPTHTNEASTTGGAVNPNTRLERFIANVRGTVQVVVPLSDVTRHFDGKGQCTDCT